MTNPSETALDLYLWTVEDYHRLVDAGILEEDSPVELLNGQILLMSPSKDLHASCIDRLDELFRDLLGKSVIVRVQSPIVIDEYSEPEPDLSILRRKENFYADGHPGPKDIHLVVEVSDTTLAKDQNIKKPVYAAAGIAEYWIINLPEQQLEQYLNPFGNDYQLAHIYKAGQTLESALLGSVPVDDVLPPR